MPRHLVLFAHPRAESFNRRILDVWVETATAHGDDVRVRDLYAMRFDPVLTETDLASFRGQAPIAPDVAIEREHVLWSERITVISPVWWIGWPAILKGWIDRVFAFGFAYAYGPQGVIGLLSGRQAMLVDTTGSTEAHWRTSGKAEAMRIAQDVGTFELSGIPVLEHLTLSPVGRLTPPEAFEHYLSQVRELAGRYR